MLIVEGADLVGKTTLCDKLLELLAEEGYTYAHLGPLPNGFNGFYGYIELIRRRAVQDRFVLSELAYRMMDDKPVCISPFHYKLLEAWMLPKSCFTVVVLAEPGLITTRYREGELYTADEIERVNRVFIDGWRTQRIGQYPVTIDTSVYCNVVNPYPMLCDARRIVSMYRERLDMLDRLRSRIPTWVRG
jgi:hypothetical protein